MTEDDALDALDALDVSTTPTIVGRHRGLTIETMTMARQKALKKAIKSIDLKPLIGVAMPIFNAADAGAAEWGKALAENANAIIAEVMDLVGGETLHDLAAVMLDTEANYEAIVDALGDGAKSLGTPSRSKRFKTYLGCDGLREYIAEVITTKQAIYAITKSVEMSDYKTLGKAAFGMLISGMQGVALAKAGANGVPVPEVPEGESLDGEAM